jgi:two-component sensor histidine kinase
MRQRVNAFDWAKTPMGQRSAWPSELEIIVRQILDSSFPKAIVWGPEYTTVYNDAFLPILGDKPDALGRSFADISAEAWDTIGPIADRAYLGEPTYIEDFPLIINRTGVEEQAWFTFCYSPLRLADGSIAGMLDTVIETTGKVRAQSALALANEELGHRLKNTLALIQAIAIQTFRASTDAETMSSFSNRLQALGRAHDVLLRHDWTSASFREVVSETLKPHDPGNRISVSGPAVALGSRAAVALSMMLTELATNATKYGALSNPSGRVFVEWSCDDDKLLFDWREIDGPRW